MDYDSAKRINICERDVKLGLYPDKSPFGSLEWHKAVAQDGLAAHGWETKKIVDYHIPCRIVEVPLEDDTNQERSGEATTRYLREYMFAFPSAPIYSTHRKFEYQKTYKRLNMHTFRLLVSAELKTRVSRIYLLHNGLNEVDNMGFYYKLASLLIENDPAAACLLRPLPGHLTRFPLPGSYAEKPLDRYLGDAGDLFRQFLRYMIETQWLLSILVPYRRYPEFSGLDLLCEGGAGDRGRANDKKITAAIMQSWCQVYKANDRESGPGIDELSVRATVQGLRDVIGWTEHAAFTEPPRDALPEPRLHVIGYSLGGFFAQAIFFAWQFVISSCSTLCSGGALRDVRPKVFAHPEEWQSVLYALHYELYDAMLHELIKERDGAIAGVKRDHFAYLFHIFFGVFIQDAHGRYRSRVSEYADRLLFMVGGDDPIVRPKSVMDASPSTGVNMVEVARLTHFLHRPQRDWQAFWLPQVAQLLTRFARHCETNQCDELTRNWAFFDVLWHRIHKTGE